MAANVPAPPMTPAQQLHRGLAALGLAPGAAVEQRLLDFLALLGKWNRTYNLTAVRDPEEMVTRHLLDSLAIEPHLRGPRVLDVGTGAGLPGIPLALVHPELSFVMLDSLAKKIHFVRQAIAELGLTNAEAVQARVEDYRPAAPFDTVVARAFASIPDMLAHAGHLCARGGRFLAMKGGHPRAELDAVPAGFTVEVVHRLSVPGLDAERHLVVLTPQ